MMRVRSLLSVAALTMCGVVAGVAQETGVSHPDEAVIEASPEMAPVAVAKPSAAVPMRAARCGAGVWGVCALYGCADCRGGCCCADD